MKRRRTQLQWMRTVQVGDVLISGTGDYRVVRSVSRFPDGDLRVVSFAIRRCSWTHRPLTWMGFTDLRMLGYRHSGARYGLRTSIDRKLAAEAAHSDLRELDCCDVVGCP